MVEIGACQDYAGDRRIARRVMRRPRMKLRRAFDLRRQVGRGSGEKPRGAVGAQSNLSLGASLVRGSLEARLITYGRAVSAAAIPLRKPAPGRRTGDTNAHL